MVGAKSEHLSLCFIVLFKTETLHIFSLCTKVCLEFHYCVSGLDAWVARQLKQTSRSGAWLDVVVDNFGPSYMLWAPVSWLVSSIEWCIFVCNHNARGPQWKNSFMESPIWVHTIIAAGFRTPQDVLAVGSLHGLPVWLYASIVCS
uniref:Uncharacterized protein n=1 Tax=Electrophorus electricus TaxID=8005 RepID=A0A4W4HQ53_ELEEL